MSETLTAFDEGHEAASSAIFLEDNPYAIDSPEYELWEDGWWSFFYSHEDDC